MIPGLLVAAGLLLSAYEFNRLHRKIRRMSASLDRLKNAASAVTARVAALEEQVKNPPVTGTPDAELDAISAQLEAIVAPTVPAPAP